ncbi:MULTISPECIES: flagellar export protein FliJ [Carboxydocella]|uniref:Flagellar FliJ protein n=2 Tax=Carboxydocella TaxID=178898 RepID=A0A1T4PAL7_9FIRM|nr:MULTISPECIES: flagellar export protein FliJ [Carboxydocella]AVX20771.1 flagellar export protein FliJ [Carboxydocella thermautotrophica]AVX31190.1 flagellar export protein FliJ [Carboxydocella thermautotrophica]SJZ88605.1 FliJ protein [Carboxydocella sporoproducens DSM 16521]GAW28300.1 flagellar export protein FliJ [Carboxydocella sp. ULO1]GAW32129.1 flagellar export protein FliJ [Carboxydocella sp. JDF658]
MRKFKFRLQALLDLAVKLEEQQLNKTRVAERQLRKEQETLESLMEDKQTALYSQQENMLKGCSVQELIEMQFYLDKLARQISRQQTQVAEAEKAYQDEMAMLQEKMRYRKMLENLRAKAWEEHRQKQLKEEQIILDELALVRYWYQEHS